MGGIGATISIITPTYNRANSLPETVMSVKRQSNPNWELVIVDDGSTDETHEIIKDFQEDDRIRYVYQENQGVSAARNKGVSLAKGDYLIFLDSDDIFFSDLIENLYIAEFFKYDLICWQVLKIINGKKQIWKAKKLEGMYNNLKATFFPGSICYKKETFLQAGGYDPKMTFGENYELGIRISRIKDLKIKLLHKPFLKYEIDTSQRTSNSLRNRWRSHLHQYKKHKSLYDKNLKAKSEMNYIMGFVLEKLNRRSAAFDQYKNAWINNPWRLKPFLKIIYFKVFG